MRVTSLSLSHFRNYERALIEPDAGVTVFTGPNAQGKTNVLEALHLCCLGKSHRTSRDEELIQWGRDSARVTVKTAQRDGTHEVAVVLSRIQRKKKTIVLAGIGVHALAQTALMCLKLMADPERELASIEYWMMGSLSNVSASRIGLNLVICLVCGAALFPLHRQTVLLSAEEGEARLLGVSVGRVRLLVLTLATLAVAAVVSLTGLISFIGLLAPHGARLLMKGSRKSTMLLSGLLGGCLLCAGDIFARSVAAAELPVSVFTSLIGAPALIYLTLGRREEG